MNSISSISTYELGVLDNDDHHGQVAGYVTPGMLVSDRYCRFGLVIGRNHPSAALIKVLWSNDCDVIGAIDFHSVQMVSVQMVNVQQFYDERDDMRLASALDQDAGRSWQ